MIADTPSVRTSTQYSTQLKPSWREERWWRWERLAGGANMAVEITERWSLDDRVSR